MCGSSPIRGSSTIRERDAWVPPPGLASPDKTARDDGIPISSVHTPLHDTLKLHAPSLHPDRVTVDHLTFDSICASDVDSLTAGDAVALWELPVAPVLKPPSRQAMPALPPPPASVDTRKMDMKSMQVRMRVRRAK